MRLGKNEKLNFVVKGLLKSLIGFLLSLENNIQDSTQKLGTLLNKVKGGGQVPKQQVASEADMILEPLMELLDVSLVHYSNQCEKTVLKKLLKV